jgi:outer membrane protein TolC
VTENVVSINLPTALSMVGGNHPIVGIAQWRVQEAYARLAGAKSLWLPTLQAGLSFARHEGHLQNAGGQIIDVERNSFQYGLGTGAVAAGTTVNPGLVAQFHLADAIFRPKVAATTAWARGHAAQATLNQQLFLVASAYTELVGAEQEVSVLTEMVAQLRGLAKMAGDFAASGEGLRADAQRIETELKLIESRLVAGRERAALASVSLALALSTKGPTTFRPLDVNVVPLEMIDDSEDPMSLVNMGLTQRAELKESQALVAAAWEAFRREKYAPFIPSVLLGFSSGAFGGGQGNDIGSMGSRYDLDAVATWQVRNLGAGECSARREACSRIQQAKYEKLRLMDQISHDILQSHSQIGFRRQQIQLTEQAISSAQSSYELNLERIRNGKGLPLDVLQSIQALEQSRRAYLRNVVDFNQAQFRLQWAVGWPSVFQEPFRKDGLSQ